MTTSTPIRVLVISPVRLYREGLCGLLSADPTLQLVGAVAAAAEATADRVPHDTDVLLIDATALDGAATVARLREQLAHTRLVAIAVQEVDEEIVACAETGVDALISSDATVDDLLATLRGLDEGHIPIPTTIAAALFRHVSHNSWEPTVAHAQLTRREAEIVALIDTGLSNKQIAQHLSLSVPTVKNHVHNILQKLCVSRRSAAAAIVRTSRVARYSRSGSKI